MTALRELAEVRELVGIIADWKLPETGETWPSGGAVGYETMVGSSGVRDYMRNIATKALSILDAEGDGGAVGGVPVAWVADLAPGIERPKEYMGIFTPYKGYAEHLAKHADYVVTPLFTHPQPVRSGVVSDEDVGIACRAVFGDPTELDAKAMRAAPSAPQGVEVCTRNCDCVGPCKMGVE